MKLLILFYLTQSRAFGVDDSFVNSKNGSNVSQRCTYHGSLLLFLSQQPSSWGKYNFCNCFLWSSYDVIVILRLWLSTKCQSAIRQSKCNTKMSSWWLALKRQTEQIFKKKQRKVKIFIVSTLLQCLKILLSLFITNISFVVNWLQWHYKLWIHFSGALCKSMAICWFHSPKYLNWYSNLQSHK